MYRMKKVISILLLSFYLAISAVSAISWHYCHGKLVDFSVNKPAQSCCDDETQTKSSCCSDGYLEVDLDDNQISSNKLEINSVTEINLLNSITSEAKNNVKDCSHGNVIDLNASPDKLQSKVFILTQSFLFYG